MRENYIAETGLPLIEWIMRDYARVNYPKYDDKTFVFKGSCHCKDCDIWKCFGKRDNWGPCVRCESAFKSLYKRYVYGSYRKFAHSKNPALRDAMLNWGLTLDQFQNIIQQDCHYCGQKPSAPRLENNYRNHWALRYFYNGIDRIDNQDINKGYEPGNVLPCCRECNFLRGNKPYDEFVAQLNRIAIHRSPQILRKAS